jgi:hypothetical protein
MAIGDRPCHVPAHRLNFGDLLVTDWIVKAIAASQVSIQPGGVRAVPWHAKADERLLQCQGYRGARVFNAGRATFYGGDNWSS